MTEPAIPPCPDWYDKKVALVLQGGGALGSYQAGVYEALSSSPYQPDWLAGISIGAINAALIAGNAPPRRVERLRAFWERITEPPALWPLWLDETVAAFAGDHRPVGAVNAMFFGQPGFFQPRSVPEWFLGPRPTSYYDTSALRQTLEELIDFDRINSKETRLSVGAVNVETGNFVTFDNATDVIGPEHIMASGALPPGFPAICIDDEYYWDGGLVSNTPLHHVLTSVPRRSRITFQVDLFASAGRLPDNLEEVSEREQDIRYSSRTRAVTNQMRQMHDLRHNINSLLEKLPPELRALPEADFLYQFGCVTTMDIVQLVYRPRQTQGRARDFEFSRRTMQERWAQGHADAMATLAASPWLTPAPAEVGLRTFDVLHGDVDPARPAMRDDDSSGFESHEPVGI